MSDYPVEIENLTVQYGERVVLEEIDFKAHVGQINVIIGGSGCGKSTLLRHALGLESPKSGMVKLFGHDIEAASDSELKAIRMRIGVLFQTSALFTSMTVGENVALVVRENTDVPEPIIDEIVRIKLSLVGLEDAIDLYPEQLSGGMRKRAGLARAFATDPELLFCDEPSAGLDPVVASELDDLLRNLKERFQMTMVIVTHDIESIRKVADRVAMLDEGRFIAQGSVEEVLKRDDRRVYDFFNRISHSQDKARASLYAVLKGEGE